MWRLIIVSRGVVDLGGGGDETSALDYGRSLLYGTPPVLFIRRSVGRGFCWPYNYVNRICFFFMFNWIFH